MKTIESGFPFKEIEGIKRRLTMKDPIEDFIPLGKSLYPFFYITYFFIFLFLGLSLISGYQIMETYHINRFIHTHMEEAGVQIIKKGLIGRTVLDLVSYLII